MLDKMKGGLFGFASGDAMGGTTEFMTKEEIEKQYGKVTEIIGSGHCEPSPFPNPFIGNSGRGIFCWIVSLLRIEVDFMVCK